jgi:hypothetical protein
MRNYNPWSSKEKTRDDQQQCHQCKNWDIYIFHAVRLKDKKKLQLCYQCFHQLLGNGQIEDGEN